MGRAHALAFARRGATVAAMDIDEAGLDGTADLLRDERMEAHMYVVDVTDRQAVEAAVEDVIKQEGRVDGIVSNAGTIHASTGLLDTDDDDWHRTIEVNTYGALNLTRAALPVLKQSPSPRIVLISSIWAQRGPGFGHAYCAAKGALLAFGRNLAVELGRFGICVNSVAPGGVRTRMANGFTEQDIAEDSLTIPLGRWGEKDEISNVVAFLLSPESSYLTGQTVTVSGGQVTAGF